MPSERIQRQIDSLLDEAELAVKALDWEAVRDRARAVLAIDENNGDAQAYLKAAGTKASETARPSRPKDPPPLETCRVGFSLDRSMGDSLWANMTGAPAGDYWFWAEAESPLAGRYPAACSPKFKPGAMQGLRNWATKNWDFNPQAGDGNAAQAHRFVVDVLLSDGWEPTPFHGHNWWEHTFQRRVRREEDGWTILQSVERWDGYWVGDPEDPGDDDPMVRAARAAGKFRRDNEGVWLEESFLLDAAKENGASVSVTPAYHGLHIVSVKAGEDDGLEPSRSEAPPVATVTGDGEHNAVSVDAVPAVKLPEPTFAEQARGSVTGVWTESGRWRCVVPGCGHENSTDRGTCKNHDGGRRPDHR